MVYALFPYYNTRESIKLIMKVKDSNILSDGKTNTGKKVGAACLDIQLEDVKKIYKQRKVSINEFYFGAVSQAFYRYLKKRSEEPG